MFRGRGGSAHIDSSWIVGQRIQCWAGLLTEMAELVVSNKMVEPGAPKGATTHKVASVTAVKTAGRHVQWIGNAEVLVVNTKNGIRVFSGMCPHQGGPLAEGEFTETTVTCPWHGCTFDLDGGACVDMGACRNVAGGMRLKPIPFEVKDDQVFVTVEGAGAS